MAVWPTTIPQAPLEDGFSRAAGDGVLRTDMDTGIAKTRRRFTAVPDVIQCTFRMSTSELSLFREWVNLDIGGGSTRFTWVAPDTGVTRTFRLKSSPTISSFAPGVWRVSMQMEQLP